MKDKQDLFEINSDYVVIYYRGEELESFQMEFLYCLDDFVFFKGDMGLKKAIRIKDIISFEDIEV